MIFALNEIKDIIKKAAMSAGLPVGLAEDVSQAGEWLVCQGLDGVGAVLIAIEGGFNNVITTRRVGRIFKFLDARVALCGLSSVELLAADASVDKIHLFNVDSPLLLIGQAGIGSKHFGIELTLEFSDGITVFISRQGLSLNGAIPNRGADVLMTGRKTGQIASFANIKSYDIEIDLETWSEIEALAARTYVPSNDISRAKGAGAGLIDN